MSLKILHLVFIALSVILAFGFSWWAFYFYGQQAKPLYLFISIASFVFGFALIGYEVLFLKKTKDIHF